MRIVANFIIYPIKEPNHSIQFLGEGEGTWPIIPEQLHSSSVCYCIGVGVNATFDIELAKNGYTVHSFDPTPRALNYAKDISLTEKGVNFHPIGVWDSEITLKFFAPSNDNYANFSTTDLHGTGKFIEAKCKTLSSIKSELNHDSIDLVKLDVEGSWQPIILDMLNSRILPKILCVEFDSPTNLFKVLNTIKKIESNNYKLAWRDKDNYLFCRI